MKISGIDNGNTFDWGKTSKDYAKFRDIYPAVFYEKLFQKNIGIKGQQILDLGTGTGVLPRNMYHYGADWTGIDISENQIAQAKLLSEQQNMKIAFETVPAEKIDFPENTFDVITACQCFWYFDTEILMPVLKKILRPDGRLVLLQMEWLPFEDEIAGASENLVLKYNPHWTGAGETRKPVFLSENVLRSFELISHEEFDVKVPFTRETWNGRMKACRGVGASLSEQEAADWEKEHLQLLNAIAPASFEILHYIAIAELKAKIQQ